MTKYVYLYTMNVYTLNITPTIHPHNKDLSAYTHDSAFRPISQTRIYKDTSDSSQGALRTMAQPLREVIIVNVILHPHDVRHAGSGDVS